VKVIHVPFGYYPDSVGGTEVYVAALAKHLCELGVENVVSAPGSARADYEHDGLQVRRFPVNESNVDLGALYGEGDEWAAQAFSEIVENERPDIVHLHAFTMGVCLRLLRQAKRRGCRVVFSYHTPGVSCIRGTLLMGPETVCDGRLETRRCSRCAGSTWGLSWILGSAIACLPERFGRMLGRVRLQGGLWTALRCTELIAVRHRTIRALFKEADRLVAVCSWVKRLLRSNGVPEERIVLCRQGLPCVPNADFVQPAVQPTQNSKTNGVHRLRVAFFGRAHPSKGPQVLIEAFRRAADLRAALDLYTIGQGRSGEAYRRHLQELAALDSRICFRDPVPSKQVTETLTRYDVLAVPSQGLETGPLVVLEAFAAGVPVIGWNAGGLSELVQNEVNGLLINAPSVEEWIGVLRRCVQEPLLLQGLSRGVRQPRTMREVARETLSLYETL
jgi:glycosyltransferase involved in cell wall biosynthesis